MLWYVEKKVLFTVKHVVECTVCLTWLHCSTGESQWLQYFNLVFLEIQNVPLRTVFANPVTYYELLVYTILNPLEP